MNRVVKGWHTLDFCTLGASEIALKAKCACGAPAVFHDGNARGTATHAWRCEACFVVIALASD